LKDFISVQEVREEQLKLNLQQKASIETRGNSIMIKN